MRSDGFIGFCLLSETGSSSSYLRVRIRGEKGLPGCRERGCKIITWETGINGLRKCGLVRGQLRAHLRLVVEVLLLAC